MTKANECTCPSGDGSLRHPCPAHPASVELAGVAAKLTFINGRPAMCGCQVEYSSGGGEYSDVIYVTLCAKHSGSAILDLVATNRIALTPEYEGQWHADLYLDREIPLAKADGATPAEAVLALMSAERIDPEQESVEQAGGDERDLQGAQGERDGWGPFPIVQVPWNVFDRAVMWVEDRRRYGDDGTIVDDWKALKTIQRAALAQPSPKCATCNGTGQIVVSGPHYCGELQPPEYETEPCDMCSQPSPAQAEVERPEVVGVRYEDGTILSAEDCGTALEVCAKVQTPLMTVAQHERIVVAEKGKTAAAMLESHRQFVRQFEEGTVELITQRDAALARCAELEAKLSDPTAVHQWQFSNAWFDGSEDVVLKASKEGSPIRTLYTAPAQAQHSVPIAHEFKRALGLVVAALEADGDRPTSKYALSELKKGLAAAPGKEVGHE
ncbi:TPA: hypothetical protein ACSQZH_003142 [Pseudomonas aeruginosa]